MRESVRVATGCAGAEKVLYLRFRDEPFLTQVLGSRWHIYAFFRALVELAQLGYPRLLCIKHEARVAAAAIYTLPEPPRAHVAFELLKLAIRAVRPSALLGFLRSASGFLAYVRALRGLEPSGHLLFIASAIEGRGYGSLLLRLVERACAKAGCRGLVLEVHAGNPAVRFYVKRGFRPRASLDWFGVKYFIMVKPLTVWLV